MPTKLLLVEDEQMLRESLAQLLSDEGYQVVQTGNGKEGYEAVVREAFDLVLTDIHMPVMDGLAMLKQLQAVIPQTPVIVFTAFGTVDSAVNAIRCGGLCAEACPV